MKVFLFSSLACLFFTVNGLTPEAPTPTAAAESPALLDQELPAELDPQNDIVEICKEILPFRPDFDNLDQCVKLFRVCGEAPTPDQPTFAACFCEILELNNLSELFGYTSYGDCVSSRVANNQ